MNNYLDQEIKRLEDKILKARESLSDPQLKELAQEEIDSLQDQLASLKSTNIPFRNGMHNKKETNHPKEIQGNVILEIRSAAGGEEAKIWADDLLEMYTLFALAQNLEVTPLEKGMVKIKGKNAYSLFQFEAGVHRVQRIPTTESHGRIHTSTTTVAVLPEVKESEIVINPKDVEIAFYRSSGSGGQNVNKVSTAVRLKHLPSGIVIESQSQRYQEQNRKIAFDLLRARLFQIEKETTEGQIKDQRQEAVGRGMRAEKIRTYNFPQNRVTDHRLNQSFKNLDRILEGDLLPIVKLLQASL